MVKPGKNLPVSFASICCAGIYQDFHSGCKVKKDDGYFQFVKKMLQFVVDFPRSVGNYNV